MAEYEIALAWIRGQSAELPTGVCAWFSLECGHTVSYTSRNEGHRNIMAIMEGTGAWPLPCPQCENQRGRA